MELIVWEMRERKEKGGRIEGIYVADMKGRDTEAEVEN